MASHLGWENRTSFFWERPLGTGETTGILWLSAEADSMGLGAEATRRRVYGNRYMLNAHLQVLKSNPGGSLGATELFFDRAGTQTTLNRMLNTHFQNTAAACPVPPLPCWVAHFPVNEQPASLSGFTIARDIGLDFGSAYVWESCVCNELVLDWQPGKAMTIKPTFVALDGQPDTAAPGIVATDVSYQYQLYQAPNIACTWNGSKVETAGFTITSNNGIVVKHDPSSISPVGMTLGNWAAKLQLKVWVDDDFYKYVPNSLGSSVPIDTTGTFEAVITGPTVSDESGSSFTYMGTVHFHGKVVDMPNAQPTKDGIQIINVEMTSPETGGSYDDAGYFIKIDSSSFPWQLVV